MFRDDLDPRDFAREVGITLPGRSATVRSRQERDEDARWALWEDLL